MVLETNGLVQRSTSGFEGRLGVDGVNGVASSAGQRYGLSG